MKLSIVKKLLLMLAAALCFFTGLGARDLSILPERRALIELISELNGAAIHCNTDTMNRVLADRVYLDSALVKKEIDRDEFINGICINNGGLRSIEIEAVSVEIDGDAAVVKFRSTVRRVSREGGKEWIHHFDEEVYFQNQDGTWRAISFYDRPVETGPGDLERFMDLLITLFS